MDNMSPLDDYLEDTLNILRIKIRRKGLSYSNGDTKATLIRRLNAADAAAARRYSPQIERGNPQSHLQSRHNASVTQPVSNMSNEHAALAVPQTTHASRASPTKPHLARASGNNSATPVTPEDRSQSSIRPQISPSPVRERVNPVGPPAEPRAQSSPFRSPNKAVIGSSLYKLTEVELESICVENFLPRDLSADDFPECRSIQARWESSCKSAADKLNESRKNAIHGHENFAARANAELDRELEMAKKRTRDKINNERKRMEGNVTVWEAKNKKHLEELTRKKEVALEERRQINADLVAEKKHKWGPAFACLKEKRAQRGLSTFPDDFDPKGKGLDIAKANVRKSALDRSGVSSLTSSELPGTILNERVNKYAIRAPTAPLASPKRHDTPLQSTGRVALSGNTTHTPSPLASVPKTNLSMGKGKNNASPMTTPQTGPARDPLVSSSERRALGTNQAVRKTSIPQPKRKKGSTSSSPSPPQVKAPKRNKHDEQVTRSASAPVPKENSRGVAASPLQEVLAKGFAAVSHHAQLSISAEDFKTHYGRIYTPYLFLSKDEIEVCPDSLKELDTLVRTPPAPVCPMFQHVVANATGYFITFRPRPEGDEQAKLAYGYLNGKELKGKQMVLKMVNCTGT